MSIVIDHLDHLVFTVADIEVTCSFYELVLGMKPISVGNGRRALRVEASSLANPY